ncbi:MAG: glutamate--cysteine ligase [bacterium]|nr:glutamate--cysteine ligase [bacterium]
MHRKLKKALLYSAAKHGLERETVRTDSRGRLAETPHPRSLGSPLTHPSIMLDFSEAQLEFVSPPFVGETGELGYLKKLMSWSYRAIGTEHMWPFSMPPKLPPHSQIPLANFGTSDEGMKKRLYREGLKRRYGGAVQTISGIHYNFSLSDDFWAAFASELGSALPLWAFKDAGYFGLMRNIIRYSPLVTYLFGASPAADKSFFQKVPPGLKKLDSSTYFGPYATSLRLSDYGYHNARRVPVSVSYNSLEEYANDLYRAVSTPSRMWSSMGVFIREKQIQLNPNILQMESEFYTSVRPKQRQQAYPRQSLISSLASAGVGYIEFRDIDIDPYEPLGIGKDELCFLYVFMMYCLFSQSPKFKNGEQNKYEANQPLVALHGRKPGLRIYSEGEKEDFTRWSIAILNGMEKVALSLDEALATTQHSRVIRLQMEKVLDSEKIPSARILRDIKESRQSFAEFGLSLAKKYRAEFFSAPVNRHYDRRMQALGEASLEETARRESLDAWILSGYEHLELSTQVLIRAAQKRNIAVNVIDASNNVIELRRGERKELVKQATITRRDTYLSYELMSDKALTKVFLERAGISVPRAKSFSSAQHAIDYCILHSGAALVVKPVSTNYGIGVSILKPKADRLYPKAVRRAFKYGENILVEEFVPGKEYRFLVINGKVVAVLNREPANVVGDGAHSIKELVAQKNTDPESRKLPKHYIRLGTVEREILAEAGLNPDSVPARNQKVYLRRNSNASNGGDPLDIPDMPTAYKKIALKAAASVGANICGVDMIIRNIREEPRKNAYAIIELNWNPAIYLHAYPFKGKARDVGGAVLDFLGF